MKNKKLTYLLGVIVLAVWGMIIYRIFAAVGGSDDNIQTTAIKTVKEPYNDFNIPKDTTHLLLNYRDPFGLIKFKDTTETIVGKHNNGNIPLMAKPAINWNFIQYSGYIRNPASKKLIALVSINGKNEMLSEGDTRDHVKLIKNLRDSIKVGFGGKTKFIVIKSASL
ncbi:MAG: hypothetical protein JWP37_4426 [Mucilaginibacter sp.]|nr:hypothetical protein [Mucilaginibacter sp.]